MLASIAAAFFFSLSMVAGSSQVVWQRAVPPELQGRVFSVRATIAMSAIPLASLLAGPLADGVFEPAMAPGHALAQTLGPLIGVGKGRGIALIILVAGALSTLAALAAGMFGPLRRLDSEREAGRREPASAEAPG